MRHGLHARAGRKFLFDIIREITAPIENSDVCHRFAVTCKPAGCPVGEMQGVVRPDTLQVGPHIQAKLIRHAAISLAASKAAGADNGHLISRHAFGREMKRKRRRAEAAADYTDGCGHVRARRQRFMSAVAANSSIARSMRSNMSFSSASLTTSGGQKPTMSPGSARRMTPCSWILATA